MPPCLTSKMQASCCTVHTTETSTNILFSHDFPSKLATNIMFYNEFAQNVQKQHFDDGEVGAGIFID